MALWITDYVVVNKYSRPAEKLTAVKGIVMHWTATNGASDTNEQSFFDGADGGGSRYASAHMFVDSDSATLIIPLNEVAYHANEHACRVTRLAPNANFTSIGIEMCVEKDGTIHPNTVARCVDIVASLCKQYGLNPSTDIFRHYDVTGKNCPAPWVSNSALFTNFKNNVKTKMAGATSTVTSTSRPVLKTGDTGSSVKDLQTLLNAKGYNLTVDGSFGNGTLTAVKSFQTANGLTADGIVGEATWSKLTFIAPKNGWKQEDGNWYFYINNAKKTGWLQADGKWYFLDGNGVMKTGWQLVNGKWYFFNTDGVMQYGWLQDGGNWYYLNKDGDMAIGWLQLEDGRWFFLDIKGIMVTGWQKIGEKDFLFLSNGEMATSKHIAEDGSWAKH